ncbi:hypothetical protein MHL30_13360 [Priestia flexa]|uniref:phage tail spike protein n=1 Tax=Priestia flexa TaxID=86664 RepID=UPI001EF567B5|nr:phage tail spike protein [Priestia flexa]MCG7314151.1 hypothetical protein [Priestia flexa]
MIHVLNSQSDHIVAFLSHGLEAATHTRNSNLEEVLTFSWPAIDEKAAFILQRNRAVIEDEDGQYREFIIDAAEKDGDVLEVTATASYLDLKKAKAIAPITLTGQTAATATSYVLAGTEWEPGVIEHAGVRKVVFDKHINPYLALQQLASEFGLELVFRVEISGNRIVRRVVDLVTRVGRFKGKEIVFGKDLLGLVRKEKSDEIVTALLCLGPEKEDGTRITTTVEDEEARQRWGRNNQHLWDIYEPESSDQDMTVERLKSLGETALKKRINSVVEYEISQGDLESIPGYEHEQFRFGDTVRIKDLHYKPPLYMEARTISVERDLLDPSEKEHVLGEFIEYTERDVLAEFDDFKKNMRIRIIKQPTPPQGAYNVLWVDTSRPVHVLHTWDGVQWRKVTPTEASEVGAVTPEESQEQANKGRDEAKEYTDGKVVEIGETIEQVQQDVFNRERVIKRQSTEPVNPLYGDLWVDTSDPLQPMYMWNGTEWRALGPTNADEMGAVLKEEYEQKVQEIIADLANKVPSENYSSTVQEIMISLDGKAGLEYVNGQLSSKVNTGTVYTKTEVDNALNSRVLKTTYETDKTGIVQRLDSSENRLTVNEKEIGLRAKQQALDTVSQRVTSAEQAIVLQDGKIELMVEKETFNNLKGTVESYGTRITQAESNINLKAEKTALTTTNQNVSNALQSITNLQTEIDLAYEQIALRAKQTDFNSLSNQVSSHQAQLTVQANEIASRVTQDQFDALSISGRNLAKGSKRVELTPKNTGASSDNFNYAPFVIGRLEKGKEYTVSCKVEKTAGEFNAITIYEYTGGKTFDVPITNNEITLTFNSTSDTSDRILLYAGKMGSTRGNGVIFTEVMIEKATKKSEWAPAPEDVDEKINGLDGRISTAETNISQTATEIKSLAKKSELDTVSGRLDTAESTISQQAAAIAQRVTSSTFTQEITNTKSYADSSAQTKANTAETNAKNHANTKASTAEANAKSYTDGKISTVTTRLTSAESLITQQANEIASRVTKTEFESLSIGGRNIVKGTSNEFKTATFGGWDYYFTDQLLHWSKGDVITGRIYLKPGKYEASIMIHIRYTNGTYNQYRGNVIAAGSEGYSIVTLTIPNRDDISYIQYSIRHSSGSNPSNTVQYKEAKIEKGSRPTDWTPAPEDIDAQINSVSTRISTAESTITQQAGLIAQKVSTTDFNGNTIASKLVQTATALDLIAKNINLTGLITFKDFDSQTRGVIDGYTTSNSSSSYSGQWTRLGGFKVTGQYGYAQAQISLINGASGSTAPYWADIVVRVKQQEAMGQQPRVQIDYKGGFGLKPTDFAYSVTTNSDSETFVRVYLCIRTGYEQYKFTPSNIFTSSTGSVLFYDNFGFGENPFSASQAGYAVDRSHNETTTMVGKWTYPNTTRINGGEIQTRSIAADCINVSSLSAISANLGIVTTGELRSVIIRASTFDTLTGSVINIGGSGAGIDLYDGSFRLKQSAGHYYSINNSGQHIFWQGSDPFIRIQKTQDSDSNPAVQGARAQLVFLKDRTAVYARNAANTDYADFAANEFRAIGKYVSIVNGNLESTTGYMAVTAATENTGSTQHVYLRPSGSGSVHVLRNTSFNIDSSSPDYRPIIVQTVGTRSTSLSKTNIREVDFKATSLLKDVDVHEYHTISDVVGGNYFDKKIGFITEMTPALMKFENNIDLYTTLALVWKQNQEQQEEIERLEKEKNDIHDVLGVLIQEIDALKKAVSAA